MDDGTALLASLGIGLMGMALLGYGKKQGRVPQMVVGVVLMAYPFFVSNVLLMVAIAAVLLLGLALAVKRGL
jgi:hypothetical protein